MVATFERRLGNSEQKAKAVLECLQSMPEWWRDVLDARYRSKHSAEERRLLVAVRNGYLNAYADGHSILKVGFRKSGAGVQPRCEIHRKYVLGPKAGDGRVIFDGKQVGDMPYEGSAMLQSWITAALDHADQNNKGAEKRGVATIAARHPNTIDVEMALPANEPVGPDTRKTASLVDLVTLERAGDGVQIVFYEAKQFSNPELRAKNLEPEVLDQLRKYEDYASDPIRRQQIIDAYRNACVILRDIAAMRGAAVGSLVHEVASNPWLQVSLDPKPRLVVFGYSSKQVSDKHWPQHQNILRDSGYTLLMEERAEDVQLSSCRSKATAEQHLRTRLQGLARFVPAFTRPGFRFGAWNRPPPRASGIHVLPSYLLSDEGQEFYKTVYKLGWVTQFQWSEWEHTPEGCELTGNPGRIAEATPDQLAKVVTVCIRKDRFSEGLLGSAFESGLLTAIVRRAAALLQTPPCSGAPTTTEQ